MERPRNPEHGDYATNLALQVSKKLGVNPRDFAGWLAEALTKQAGVPLLVSEDFATALDQPCRLVGRFPLKGVAEPQALYAVDDG